MAKSTAGVAPKTARATPASADRKKAGVSREAAVQAALEAIDDVGLDSFSLPMVAERLQIRTPSLYHHFRDKSEILAEVARAILLDAEKDRVDTHGDWKEALIAISEAVRRSVLRHPNAAPLLLIYPPRHIALSGYERTTKILNRGGVPVEHHMALIYGLDGISWGSVLFEAMARAQGFSLYPVFDPIMFPGLSKAKKAFDGDELALFRQTMLTFMESFEKKPEAPAPKRSRQPRAG